MKKIIFQIIVFILLPFFVGDAVAIWDLIELVAPDSRSSVSTTTNVVAFQAHNVPDTSHDLPSADWCPLCPGCASHVHVFCASFALENENALWGLLVAQEHQLPTLCDSSFFHPPRLHS
jgi:hypothetical protein